MACVGVRKGVCHVPAIEMMGSVAGKLVKNALHDCQGWLGWWLVLRVAQFEAQALFFLRLQDGFTAHTVATRMFRGP